MKVMSRILLVSDIHGNLAALDAVLRDAQTGGDLTGVWCLGDTIGYGPQPNECLAMLQKLDALAVAGNHELAALGKIRVDDFNAHARGAAIWTAGVLEPDAKAYAESLPMKAVTGEFTLVHGSPRDPVWEYVVDPGTAFQNLPHLDTPHCINGHTHVPAVLHTSPELASPAPVEHGAVVDIGGGTMFINPGSVGQPRDGDPRASYAILDDAAGTVGFYRVEYQVEKTQSLMRQFGLPEMLWQRLTYGF
jgi:predicted phosphodiesterase